jgi:hypothetical protein
VRAVTTSTLPSTRSAALRAVSTVSAATREVIAGDDDAARDFLSSLSLDELSAILEALSTVLGLVAAVETAKKETR